MFTKRAIAFAAALWLGGCEPPPVPPAAESIVVYVVRHAERADDGAGTDGAMSDPPLSEAGEVRARELADLMSSSGLTHVYTTQYRRTRSTAGPVSEALGLTTELYDSSDPVALAEKIRAAPGTHLVVGHSNTVPDLVRALGGEPGGPIRALEYDRIYVLHLRPDAPTRTVLLRYGARGPG